MDTPIRARHASLRQGRRSVPGIRYFITFTTYGRVPLFSAWEPAAAMSRLLAPASRWAPSRLHAWVLMPDHWHGIVELGPAHTLAAAIGRAKGASAHGFNRLLKREGPVWARAYHDRALRKEDNVRTSAQYLVANPLRAGLVDRIGDYPFWDAIWLSDENPL